MPYVQPVTTAHDPVPYFSVQEAFRRVVAILIAVMAVESSLSSAIMPAV
jgi:hypothetical protein